MKPRTLKKKLNIQPTSWNEVSSWYDGYVGQDGSPFHQTLILPGIRRMLQLPKEARPYHILDLACGQGVLQRYFTEPWIHHVGVDASPELIEKARHRTTHPQTRYVVGDVTKLLIGEDRYLGDLTPASFDAVTLVLAIQNITPLSAVWKGIYQLLKPNGSCIMVMMHPAFRIPKGATWQWNESETRQERVMWSYLTSHEIPILAKPGSNDTTTTRHFHRPLQAYINTLGNAGLLVDHLEEWASDVPEQEGVKSAALMKAKKEFPMFMAIRLRKVVSTL